MSSLGRQGVGQSHSGIQQYVDVYINLSASHELKLNCVNYFTKHVTTRRICGHA